MKKVKKDFHCLSSDDTPFGMSLKKVLSHNLDCFFFVLVKDTWSVSRGCRLGPVSTCPVPSDRPPTGAQPTLGSTRSFSGSVIHSVTHSHDYTNYVCLPTLTLDRPLRRTLYIPNFLSFLNLSPSLLLPSVLLTSVHILTGRQTFQRVIG